MQPFKKEPCLCLWCWNVRSFLSLVFGNTCTCSERFFFCSTTALPLIVSVWLLLFRRLEFQHGLSLPVPQLESVCGGVCAPVCLCSGSSHFYAWEPPLLPGGKRKNRYPDTGSTIFSLNDSEMTHKGITAAAHFLLFFFPTLIKCVDIWWSANMLLFKMWCGGEKCGKIHDFTTTNLNNSPYQTSGYACMSKGYRTARMWVGFRTLLVSFWFLEFVVICQQCTNQNEWLAVLNNK